MLARNSIDIWGGIECTINRVNNEYFDQCEYSGHYKRDNDIDLIGSLGITMLRYPVLWEKHQAEKDTVINFAFAERNLEKLKALKIQPIVGLVHHGSGPLHVNFFDGSFEKGVAGYAGKVAAHFPWIEYYTPINEPLTTARFCGLYGHWYPHKKDENSFYRILLSECKAIIMAMEEIRKINPHAKLIQTEDLSKTYSTPLLQYQADFENARRWISYDLLCGRVNKKHPLWNYLIHYVGISKEELGFFEENICIPYICGFNYYITSERYLDEELKKYHPHTHGGNDTHTYADIEAVRILDNNDFGPEILIREAWSHIQLPVAITECHLHCTREEQVRWFYQMWKTVNKLKQEGVDIRAITAWAIFGSYGWNSLVTKPFGDYEPGIFNLNSGYPRETAMALLIRSLTGTQSYHHAVLASEGWWQRDERVYFPDFLVIKNEMHNPKCQPILILGKSGTLGKALSKICTQRNIYTLLLGRSDADITDKEVIKQVIKKIKPWAIINAAGYVRVDDAEDEMKICMRSNALGPFILAELCNEFKIKLVTFSSDLVFDGTKNTPYIESDKVNALNVYGMSKVMAEQYVLNINPESLVIRTSSFFGPWDKYNFITRTLADLRNGKEVIAANDVYISPTYVPDLVNETLNVLLDDEQGICHITNDGQTSWEQFAFKIADIACVQKNLITGKSLTHIAFKATRPYRSALISEKGIKLPTWENALHRYYEHVKNHQKVFDT